MIYQDSIISRKKFNPWFKKEKKANFVTTQFDINEDGSVTPVAGKSREVVNDEASKKLAKLVEDNAQF